jgi:hypothetical protein
MSRFQFTFIVRGSIRAVLSGGRVVAWYHVGV